MKLALFAVLFTIFVSGCAHRIDRAPEHASHWPFEVRGQVADTDIAEIVAIVRAIPRIEHGVGSISVQRGGTDFEVWTSETPGYMWGGGHIVTLRKREGKWFVIGQPRVWMAS